MRVAVKIVRCAAPVMLRRRWFFKITDKKKEMTISEDERFFQDNDVDPTAAFIESLERERALLEEKEREGERTAEWKEYDREVEEVIYKIEHEWLTNPEPITKESVKRAHKVMEEAVTKVRKTGDIYVFFFLMKI